MTDLTGLDYDERLELLRLLELRDRRTRENRLEAYKPYKKQIEFHAAGKNFRERLFLASNQSGKTFSAACETAYHLTGRYPSWWDGFRFNRATRGIAGSETAELSKKGLQRLLLGNPEDPGSWGTGLIPKADLVRTSPRPGVPNAVSSITVRSVHGENSVVTLASYEQGRVAWQADTVDFVCLDEEPPLDVYSEALTRTNVTGGPVFTVFTPLKGMSETVRRALIEKPPSMHVTNMTIHDAEHYTPEEREAIIAAWPEHERDARARGIPMLGSGRVLPVADSEMSCEPFSIPSYWARINGLDLGIDHPAAFVCLAYDRDTDTVYLYDAWRTKGKTVPEQAMIVLAKGYAKMPWAWPHDALQRDKFAGTQMVTGYKDLGMNMLPTRAQFPDSPDGKGGGNSVEAGYAEMLARIQTRRFKVFSHLTDWFEEARLLHRKDGQIVKIGDDLMSATRYALMMLRYAQTPNEYDPARSRFPTLAEEGFVVLDPVVGY